MLFMVEQCVWGMSMMARYAPTHYSQVNQYLAGVYYISSQSVDVSPWYILEGKYDRLMKSVRASWAEKQPSSLVSVASCALACDLPDATTDYIFTDHLHSARTFTTPI